MKNLSILMCCFIAVTSLFSCDDNNEELFTTEPNSTVSFKTSPAPSYLLTFETKDNTAERFVWSDLEFSTPIAVTYELQASSDADNFDSAAQVASTSDTTVGVSVEQLNNVATQLGLTPFSQGSIAMRVKATTADDSMQANFSDVIILSVTPYTTESPRLWVPGNYAEASGYGPNWSPDNDNTPYLEAVEFGSTEFEGFIYMNVDAPEFKITPEMDWDESYGDAGDGNISLSAGDNFTLDGPGYYFIQVNTNPDDDEDTDDATIKIGERVWGIIGAATTPTNAAGWGDELDMTYNQDTKLWTVELEMVADNFKFRAQNWDDPTRNFGQGEDENSLDFNASDLSQDTPGRYRAELDLSTPRNYTYELIAL